MAWYRAGTIALTNGQAAVVGSGTTWVGNVQSGHAIALPDGRTYEVLAVNSNTSITLGSPYLGSTVSGQPYGIIPTQGFAQSAASLLAQLISDYQGVVTGAGAGKFGDGSAVAPSVTFAADQDTGLYRYGPNAVGISTGGVSRMVVDTFGTTIAGLGTVKYPLGGYGGAEALAITVSNNGDFTQDTRLVAGQIGGNRMFLETRNQANAKGTLVLQPYGGGIECGTNLFHGTDNLYNFGLPSQRAATIYAATGAINTSDEREKEWRGDLTEAEVRAARTIARGIGGYRWLDAIAAKGDDARLHVGVKAQAVIAALAAEGLDPMRYAFVCYDSWSATPATPGTPAVEAVPATFAADGTPISAAVPASPAMPGTPARPAGDRYGIRPDQLQMFTTAGQEQRVTALEQRLAALEAAAGPRP